MGKMENLSSSTTKHSAARILMSILFLASGTGKLGAIKPTQEYMEAYGVPGYLIWPAAALEIQGGIMLVLGIGLRTVGMVLSGWCLLTAMIFHRDLTDQTQQIMFLKNLVMAGGFLVVAEGSVDRWPVVAWERLGLVRSRVC
jgi:putative oxidoreductase